MSLKLSTEMSTLLKVKAFTSLNMLPRISTAQKMKFSIKDFFSKCDQIRRKLRIWSHLLKKSLMEMESFIFCSVKPVTNSWDSKGCPYHTCNTLITNIDCVKSVHIRIFSGLYFPSFRPYLSLFSPNMDTFHAVIWLIKPSFISKCIFLYY